MIWTDSAIEPVNPGGILTYAFIVKNHSTIVHQEAKIICKGGPNSTNNYGETAAIMAALRWLIKLPPDKQQPVIVNSDSQLAVNQSSGKWECNDEKLQKLQKLIQLAISKYPHKITFHWIPREKNTEADKLSRSLYDEEEFARYHQECMDKINENDPLPF